MLQGATRYVNCEAELGLAEKRKRFFEIREKCRVVVKYHAYADYPERKFSQLELKNLVKHGNGRVMENQSPEAIEDSFLYYPKDEDGRECKLVLLLKEIEFENDDGTFSTESIIVCSAYREVGDET